MTTLEGWFLLQLELKDSLNASATNRRGEASLAPTIASQSRKSRAESLNRLEAQPRSH